MSRLTCPQDEGSCSQENTFHFYCFICSHLITIILALLLAKWEFSWVTCPQPNFLYKIDIKSNDRLQNHKTIFTLGENTCFFIHVQSVLKKAPAIYYQHLYTFSGIMILTRYQWVGKRLLVNILQTFTSWLKCTFLANCSEEINYFPILIL